MFKKILPLLLLFCVSAWCNFPEHIEHDWKNLEDALCKERNVGIFILDREKDAAFSASMQKAIVEMFGTNLDLVEKRVQVDSDLILGVIISRSEDFATVILFLLGDTSEEEAIPLFLDCFQTQNERVFEMIIANLKQRLTEIRGCKTFALRPYIGIGE